MKIKITSRPGHNVYGENNGMYGRLRKGFESLGHTIVDGGEDMLIVPGESANIKEVQTLGKIIWWSHGCHWARGENENNKVLRDNFDNCDLVAYQSQFARHIVEKIFGEKDGIFIYNASVPDFPNEFIKWNKGEEIKVVCCSIWRAWKRLHEIERLVRLIASNGQKINLKVIGKDPRDNCPFDLPKEGENYRIEYIGLMNLEQMKLIYHNSHIGIHLAFNDFSPSSVLEMMASGLPVVVTDSGGSQDVVKNAGIVIGTDPFIDTPFPIHREDLLPKVDDQKFEEGFWKLMNNLSEYQQKNKDLVLQEANIITQAQKFINLFNSV